MKQYHISLLLVLALVSVLLGAGVGAGLKAVIWKYTNDLPLVPNEILVPERSSVKAEGLILRAIARLASSSVVLVVGDLENSNKQIIGSGFFISPAGLVVTSRHVVSSLGTNYMIVTSDQRSFNVTKILKSSDSDVALLRTSAVNTPWLTLDTGQIVKPGQPVAVIGAGDTLGISVGAVVGTGNTVTVKGNEYTHDVVQEDVIQTNAVVRRGNSGGPLLDKTGRVVGVLFALSTDDNSISFALPTHKVKSLVEQLLQDEYPQLISNTKNPLWVYGLLHGGEVPEHVCPFAYLDPSIKAEVEANILKLYREWEEFKSNTSIFNEAALVSLGCLTHDAIEEIMSGAIDKTIKQEYKAIGKLFVDNLVKNSIDTQF